MLYGKINLCKCPFLVFLWKYQTYSDGCLFHEDVVQGFCGNKYVFVENKKFRRYTIELSLYG